MPADVSLGQTSCSPRDGRQVLEGYAKGRHRTVIPYSGFENRKTVICGVDRYARRALRKRSFVTQRSWAIMASNPVTSLAQRINATNLKAVDQAAPNTAARGEIPRLPISWFRWAWRARTKGTWTLSDLFSRNIPGCCSEHIRLTRAVPTANLQL